MRKLITLLLCAGGLSAQTQVNLGTQAKNVNFGAIPVTFPMSTGTSLPSNCTAGQFFFLTSASAGSNTYAGTGSSPCVWTLQAGVAGLPDPGANGIVERTALNTTTVLTAPTSAIVGSDDTQTLTRKSIAASEINSGTLSPTVLPNPSATTMGGIESLVSVSHMWMNGISTSGVPQTGQPAFTDLLGTATTAQMPAFSGDATSLAASTVLTLATVNANIGTFGDSAHCPTFTVNAKGLVTAASQSTSCPGGGGGGGSGNATSIQSVAVSATTPTNNQVLIYSTGSTAYVPTTVTTLGNGLGTAAVGTSAVQVNISMGVRAVTTTSDTLLNADVGGLVTYANASAVSVAVPQAGLGGNFIAGSPVTIRNYGAGTVTLTPSTSTIGGNASQAINSGKACLIVSDGTNWQLGFCN